MPNGVHEKPKSHELKNIKLKYPIDVTLNSFQGLRDSEPSPE